MTPCSRRSGCWRSSRSSRPRRRGPARNRLATRWAWTLIFGLILGCAAATKLTGWFLPLPFLAWAVWYRSRPGFTTLLVGLVVGAAVLFVLMPPWWTDPIDGVVRFFGSNLDRARTIRIKVQFLRRIYDTPKESLPWYNTMVWTVLVTPVGFLVMGVLGLVAAVTRRRDEPIGLLLAGHWVFLMILRAMPHTPGHDGVRLFLPAFGVLALLGGLGARFLLDRWGRWARAAIVAALVEGIVSVAVMMPVPLSYFSPIVGGLPGATALGMEPTYYWDALDAEARRWLTEHTQPGRTIQFATSPTRGCTSGRRASCRAGCMKPSDPTRGNGTFFRTDRGPSGKSIGTSSLRGTPRTQPESWASRSSGSSLTANTNVSRRESPRNRSGTDPIGRGRVGFPSDRTI